MKKLLLIIALALGSYTGFGQDFESNPVEHIIIIESTLMSQYIDYCYADSVVVGERYILEENLNFTISQEIYYEIDYPIRYPDNRPPASYIRIEMILAPREDPTFKGYATWLNELALICKPLI